MKVYIWGTGAIASQYLEQNEIIMQDILGFIETRKTKETFMGKTVYEPDEIVINSNYDYIIVCVYYFGREIYNLCKELNIDTDKLILVDNWEWIDGSNMKYPLKNCGRKINAGNIDIKEIFPKLYNLFVLKNDIRVKRYIVVSRNGYDLREKYSLILSDEFSDKTYQTDYFRYRTFELMANEIIKKGVKGNVAEVGVFRGTFSKMINAKFPDKNMYLFDTFESFDEEEFQDELSKQRCPDSFLDGFKNTSVEKVLSIMPYPERCIVKKGLFPNTAVGLEDEDYAFVSIDVDFEKSILEGLRYFYPRLNRGGAIFIHDYNNRFLEGVKSAVDTYEQEVCVGGLNKVPLADEGGTLVILK